MRRTVLAATGFLAVLLIPNSALAASPGWSAIGTNGPGSGSANSGVDAIILFNGDLYAGGVFEGTNGDSAANHLVRWDGHSWSKVGTGPGGSAVFNAPVMALAVFEGELFAGGFFTDAGGDPTADYVARWNGTSWSGVGSNGSGDGAIPTASLFITQVLTLVPDGNDLYIGGVFNDVAGDPAADNLALWSSTNGWASASIGSTNGNGALQGGGVWAILPTAAGLYVGGSFRDANNLPAADGIAFWDGSTWSALGADANGDGWLNGSVFTLLLDGADLDVGGDFLNIEGDESANFVARWDGSSWQPIGNVTDATYDLNARVKSLIMFNGKLTAGGLFSTSSAQGVATWNGTDWITVGPANSIYGVYTLYASHTSLYAGGSFSNAAGDPAADNIAVLTTPRPDARIRRGTRAYVGNNIYNTTGLNQSKTGAKARGYTIKFGISIQNDGTTADRFNLAVSGTASVMYTVTYWHGTTNITSAVVAGTFTTPSLAPGTTYLVTAKVKVKWSATKGSSTTRRVTISSVGDGTMQDAVRFTGKRL